MEDTSIILNCQCKALECVIRVWKFEGEEEFVFETGLNMRLALFQRTWLAIKYVCNPHKYCGWSDTVITREEFDKLRKFVDENT